MVSDVLISLYAKYNPLHDVSISVSLGFFKTYIAIMILIARWLQRTGGVMTPRNAADPDLVQLRTVQYSTVQYSTVQYMAENWRCDDSEECSRS